MFYSHYNKLNLLTTLINAQYAHSLFTVKNVSGCKPF